MSILLSHRCYLDSLCNTEKLDKVSVETEMFVRVKTKSMIGHSTIHEIERYSWYRHSHAHTPKKSFQLGDYELISSAL